MSNTTRILIVDDEDSSLVGMQILLQSMGHQTVTATTALEAIGKLENEEVDIIMTRALMSELNGFELLRWADKIHPGIGRIAISSEAVNFEVFDGLCDAFIMRPVTKIGGIIREIQVALSNARMRKAYA